MAKTAFETNDALTKKVWEEKLRREVEVESFFKPYMGESSDSLVQVQKNLSKQQGDKITFGLIKRLTGAGITGRGTLEGNEESLLRADYSISLEQYRHAVRDAGALDRQRAMFSISEESKNALKRWGSEKMDSLCFDALFTTPTQVVYQDGGASGAHKFTTTASTAKSALSATYKITPDFISYAKAVAKGGYGRSFEPLKPVRHDGEDFFVLLVPFDVMYDLKVNDDFQQARREAEKRGKDNPLFKNADAIWDGVIIREAERCPTAADGGGGSVTWAKCALLGAQALTWAWGSTPEIVQRDFDYGNEIGHAWGMIAKAGKPQFDSKDYGSLGVYVARTAVNG